MARKLHKNHNGDNQKHEEKIRHEHLSEEHFPLPTEVERQPLASSLSEPRRLSFQGGWVGVAGGQEETSDRVEDDGGRVLADEPWRGRG